MIINLSLILIKLFNMILIKRERLKEWLESIGRNQEWLAQKFNVTPGYISLITNNKCKISRQMLEGLLILSGMRFEDLFSYDGRPDDREFYGASIKYNGNLLSNQNYKKILDIAK